MTVRNWIGSDWSWKSMALSATKIAGALNCQGVCSPDPDPEEVSISASACYSSRRWMLMLPSS